MKKLPKKVVKKTFSALGFKIQRAFGFEIHRQERSLAGVIDHVSRLGFRPQTVIDAGVANGTFELYGFRNANYLLIEPLEEFEEALKDISRKHKAEYVIAAASDRPGTIVINIHPDLFSSSIFKEKEGSYVDGIPREVPAVTIDDLCNERNLRGSYVIKADVQGAELAVLDGARETLKDTELVILEAQLFQFIIDGPQFYDVVCYMKDSGFVVYDIFDPVYRPLDGAMSQVDMVFVKENGQFRKHHIYATREQRKQQFAKAKYAKRYRQLIENQLEAAQSGYYEAPFFPSFGTMLLLIAVGSTNFANLLRSAASPILLQAMGGYL